ncbi:MAG: glycosyltransferase family 1 protein [Odoribacter sp.]|nr:glycosyltransferase family 1 protein [Odoribacter sp.]
MIPGKQTMKIAISARMLKGIPDDGISRFTYEVVKRITVNNPSHKFVLIFDKEFDGSLIFSPNAEGIVLKPATRHPLLWYYWHEWLLPEILQKTGSDLLLSPDGIISTRSSVPSIPVIHDINFYHRPHDIPLHNSLYYRYFFRKFAGKAARILTVSAFSKDDISSYLGINPASIDVAYNGVSEYFTPSIPAETEKFREKLSGGNPYFLFVGNFSPRKNIPGVINAYNQFRSSTPFNHKLVLTGGNLFLNKETDRLSKTSPWSSDIILTGSVLHEELRLLYSSATALLFVPWFEGFGIPAAEAMRCGTPVILSDTTSLPEIGGNAALFVSPENTLEISNAMVKVITDDTLRKSMIEKGIIESQRFTWDNCADSVWRSVKLAAGSEE